MMFTWRLASWALFVGIAAMTLGPVGLRPHTHFSPDFDRVAAYAVLGMLFALSYPQRRLLIIGGFIVAAAGALEMAQSFVPLRDAHLSDFLFKATGTVIGLIAGRFASRVIPIRHRRFVAGGIE